LAEKILPAISLAIGYTISFLMSSFRVFFAFSCLLSAARMRCGLLYGHRPSNQSPDKKPKGYLRKESIFKAMPPDILREFARGGSRCA
jgi:hypothetical protein